MIVYLRGLILGFSIAAPVGPIGVLVIRRTLANGRLVGLFSGLGAATADMIYGAIAAFGVAIIAHLLMSLNAALHLVGGLFLCYLGFRIFVSRPAEKPAEVTGRGLAGAYGSTLLLTLTNPATILSFAAIFMGLGVSAGGGDTLSTALLVAGVASGSALWWFTLSGVTNLFRTRLTPAILMWVNRVSGTIILIFGIIALLTLRIGG
ncbi:MAG TPA: LysE family transporter [Aggregatilineales bacterium]|nr:LysE family transporter [Aggregatilineales bacterium]